MMKSRKGPLAPGILLVLLLVAGIARAQSSEPKYRPGEVIIKFKANASPGQRKGILSELGAADLKPLGRTQAEKAHVSRMSVEDAVRRFKNHPKVEYIEPNYVYHTLAVPNDPRFGDLWGLRNLGQTGGTPGADIRATTAWDVTTGSDSVLV